MEAASGGGVKSATASHPCRYCLILLSDVSAPRAKLRSPQLRNATQLEAVITEVRQLRAAGHGFQQEANQLLQQYGYQEKIVCINIYFIFFLFLLLFY